MSIDAEQFSTECPNTTGRYVFSCMEIGHDTEELDVFLKDGILMVKCPDIGVIDIKTYHDNLTYPKWVKLL